MNLRLLHVVLTFGTGVAMACRPGAVRSSPVPRAGDTPPPLVLGDFQDDYNARFTISATDFFQRPRAHFHIVQWHAGEQYFVAQNDSLNASAPNRWTRVDWLPLTGMAPYEWAFCFSAYDAVTQAAAEAANSADRTNPKVGCNKFPFSRMRRMSP